MSRVSIQDGTGGPSALTFNKAVLRGKDQGFRKECDEGIPGLVLGGAGGWRERSPGSRHVLRALLKGQDLCIMTQPTPALGNQQGLTHSREEPPSSPLKAFHGCLKSVWSLNQQLYQHID